MISPQIAPVRACRPITPPLRGSRRRQGGFTLLELMVSMTLTATLLGLLSAGLYAVINEWQRESGVLDETLDKALALLQLERALFAAFPHSYIDPESQRREIYFQGEEEALRWVSAVSPRRTPGLTAWRLEWDSQEGVQLTLTPAYGDNPDNRFADLLPTTILPNYRVEFRYLQQRNEEEKEWLDEWPGEEMQSLPLAVHLVLSPLDEDLDEDVVEILAAIKSYRHEEIEPALPVF